MTEYKPSLLDDNYDDNQKRLIPLPDEKIAQGGYFGIAEALSTGTPDFGYCVQVFVSAMSADQIKSGGPFLGANDFVDRFVVGEKAFPMPLYIENKQTGAKASMVDPVSVFGLFFGFLYMNGLITTSGMEKVGGKAHGYADRGDMSGSMLMGADLIEDLNGMFNQGPKALYDLWLKQLSEYYYIEWDRDDPEVGNECLVLTKEGASEVASVTEESGQRDSGRNDRVSEDAGDAPKKKTGILRGLFGRK